MYYKEYTPRKDLQPYIECFYSICSSSCNRDFKEFDLLIPDTTTDLVFAIETPYHKEVIGYRSNVQTISGLFVVGQRTTGFQIKFSPTLCAFGVRFKSTGLAHFTNVPMHEMTQSSYAFNEVFKDTYLEERLFHAKGPEGRMELIQDFLASKFQKKRSIQLDNLVISEIVKQNGQVRLKDIYQSLSVNSRTAERKFLEGVGMTPKEFARIWRINYCLVKMAYYRGKKRLSDLAKTAGFYDQSHFNKEFQFFTGLSPRQFLSRNFRLPHYFNEKIQERNLV